MYASSLEGWMSDIGRLLELIIYVPITSHNILFPSIPNQSFVAAALREYIRLSAAGLQENMHYCTTMMCSEIATRLLGDSVIVIVVI